ncbi:CAP Gly-rich domain protein [Raphanus sativus]|nr:CAP Gly-rich domain protein [Raphanus sativus]
MEDNIKVGDRCQVEPGEKRGVVKYVGRAESLGSSYWVGIQYDEPLGKHDGIFLFRYSRLLKDIPCCRLGRMLQRKSEAEEYVFNTLFCPLISFGVASVSSQTCSDNGHFRRPNGTYDVNCRVILSFSSFQRHGSRGFLLQRFHRPGTQPYLRSRDVHPRINFRGLFRLYQNRF